MILLVLSGSDLLSERVALPLADFGSSSCVVPAWCVLVLSLLFFPFWRRTGEREEALYDASREEAMYDASGGVSAGESFRRV